MGKESIKDKLINFIGYIGWRMFCWSYPGGEDQFREDLYENICDEIRSDKDSGHIIR